jgi:type I restriction enzyme S subunit
LKVGDLILEISGGGPDQPVGRVELIDKRAMAHHGDTPRICTNFFRKIEVKDGVESAYLSNYLKFFYVSGAINNYQAGSNNLRNLNYTEYETIEVPLPPLNEQRRIVDRIEVLFAQLDKGDEALCAVQKQLTRYRQSVLKAAVNGQLTADWRAENADRLEHGRDLLARILRARRETFNGRGKYKEPADLHIADYPELPDTWTWASVEQVVGVFGNGLSRQPAGHETPFPILRISAVRPMKVDMGDRRFYLPEPKEDLSSYRVQRGDLLFTRYNGSGHLVGVCGLVRSDAPTLHPDKLIKARPVSNELTNLDYLELAWNSGLTRRHIEANTKTTSGQKGIAGSDIKAAPFPLPPVEEQNEIARRVGEALANIQIATLMCQSELARSTALRQSILKDAFTGRLVAQNPDDEPAADLLTRIKAASGAKLTRRSKGAAERAARQADPKGIMS